MKMITKILFHLSILAILLGRVKSSQSSISYKYNELFLETDLAVDHMELDISNHGCKNILNSSSASRQDKKRAISGNTSDVNRRQLQNLYLLCSFGSPIGKRLIFYTKHRFSCDFMEHDNATKIFMSAILLHRQYQLQEICGDDCSMSTEYEPKYRCANNQTLTSYWTTDQIYPEETSRDLEDTFRDLVNEIRHRLHQEEYMQNVDIYSYLLQYPVIQGEINSYGDLVTVELAALCADGTPTYNASLTCAD
ncbi:hypothetical protein EB796_018213 [Bugula neritina]|uniref:Uncharacterized protein n=1 Tax=Bugula neritina TaxID=10212 RepID=A0A7J7JCZ4_BUGNE|nr:hypothetical protein EB796_018213 [Bugula neritina]